MSARPEFGAVVAATLVFASAFLGTLVGSAIAIADDIIVPGLALHATMTRAPSELPREVPVEDCRCSPELAAPSRSRGWPWRGRLRNGVKLRETATLRYLPVEVPRGNFWGTQELVGLLKRAAGRVSHDAPGARLTVGELSRPRGGNILGHRSHENGRDVDLGFYYVDEAGLPAETRRFVNIGRRGTGRDGERTLRFDDARNWLLIQALIEDPDVTVQHVFVNRGLRARLLREGARQGADDELLARAERVVMSPHVRHPHRNHFHVRIFCPAGDLPGCRDRGPYWPWLDAEHPFQRHVPGSLLLTLRRAGAWSEQERVTK